jgi:23S rRNA pseudouridine1911/1915/1917 synthase
MSHRLAISVPATAAGHRLDRFLATQSDLSRTRLQELIRQGMVTVNGSAARASQALKEGDALVVLVPEPEATRLVPEDIPLAVAYEDDDLVVVDKPAGLVVHPGAGVKHGTLVHALVHRYPDIEGVGGVRRPGIVHRLDKDTSGLMVVAKTDRAYQALVRDLAARRLKRVYRALAWGDPRAESGVLDAPIGRDPRNRKRMAVVARGGKAARTRFRVEERFGVVCLLRLELETGRTHQIRVHLAWAGHPVVGDAVYGGGRKRLSAPVAERNLAVELLERIGRQALHAAELDMIHPVTGSPLRLRSPLPADFAEALAWLRVNRPASPR